MFTCFPLIPIYTDFRLNHLLVKCPCKYITNDLIENYSSKFKFCLTDLNSSNYLQLTKNRYNTRTIYKFVFECNLSVNCNPE